MIIPIKGKDNPKKPTAKMAKEKSKTSFSEPREVYRPRPSKEGVSITRDPKSVSYMKSNGSRSISTSEPRVNITPKKGQEKMKIKTYEKGKLVMKEKQGKDLLGRPFVKTKTTGEGGFKKGVEKKTLTKSGVKTKSTY